jgi:hypothetical protein
MKLLAFVCAVGVLVCVPTVVKAEIWSDNFDSYATGSQVVGQGGWEEWGPGAGALTSAVQALSAPNSVDVFGATDLVHQYSGSTEGQWTYSAWSYVPDNFVGESYFILLNTFAPPTYNWSVQVRFDSALGVVESEFETAQLPLITGQWVEMRAEIDLDADWVDLYYGGTLLSGKVWTEGVSGAGALNIGAVDLFANGATSIFWDDISLVPEPASLALLAFGALALVRRRR